MPIAYPGRGAVSALGRGVPEPWGWRRAGRKACPYEPPCEKSALENASADTASPSTNPCAEDVPLANINHRATQQAPCAKNALIRALRAKTALIRNPWAKKHSYDLTEPIAAWSPLPIRPRNGAVAPPVPPQDTLLRAFGRETPSYESASRPTPSYHCCFRPTGSYGRISRPTDSARRRLPARP